MLGMGDFRFRVELYLLRNGLLQGSLLDRFYYCYARLIRLEYTCTTSTNSIQFKMKQPESNPQNNLILLGIYLKSYHNFHYLPIIINLIPSQKTSNYLSSIYQTKPISFLIKSSIPYFYKQILMTKQLQDKIIRLQAQKTQQQSEFIQKKQHYQAIIQDLQSQNQKLRKYMQDNESLSMIESIAKSNKSSKVHSPVHQYDKNKPIPDDQKQNPVVTAQLIEQNRILREQLTELTKTYQEQIEQISSYFSKIQQTYSLVMQKNSNNAPKQGQISDLVKAYETLLKDFESERLKYVEKIEQLTNYIIKYDEKQKKMEEDNQRLEIQLKIVKEELKIYKRSKISK